MGRRIGGGGVYGPSRFSRAATYSVPSTRCADDHRRFGWGDRNPRAVNHHASVDDAGRPQKRHTGRTAPSRKRGRTSFQPGGTLPSSRAGEWARAP